MTTTKTKKETTALLKKAIVAVDRFLFDPLVNDLYVALRTEDPYAYDSLFEGRRR